MDNERLKKHLGTTQTVKITGEDGIDDEFTFKQLKVEDIPLLIEYQKQIKNGTPTTEAIGIMAKLAENTVRYSYPEWDADIIKQFTVSNFLVIVNVMNELNTLGTDKNKRLIERIKSIQGGKNATTTG